MERMQVSYRREMNHNYMIISVPGLEEDGYEAKMLSENNIDGFLKLSRKNTEDGVKFYYEITSRQPLLRLLDGRLISYDEIREILLSAAGMLRRAEEYLLREEQILLEPEYIYVDPEDFSVFFCLLPGYSQSFPDSFTHLLQYILDKVNHQDHRSVVLAYGLYHESLKENYGMEDLLKYLSNVESGETRQFRKDVFSQKTGDGQSDSHFLKENRDDEIWKAERKTDFLRRTGRGRNRNRGRIFPVYRKKYGKRHSKDTNQAEE